MAAHRPAVQFLDQIVGLQRAFVVARAPLDHRAFMALAESARQAQELARSRSRVPSPRRPLRCRERAAIQVHAAAPQPGRPTGEALESERVYPNLRGFRLTARDSTSMASSSPSSLRSRCSVVASACCAASPSASGHSACASRASGTERPPPAMMTFSRSSGLRWAFRSAQARCQLDREFAEN
jgi:hypothetical protein